MQANGPDQRGMTVAELLVAVAIIGIGLIALFSAVPIAAYGIREGNELSTATFLAEQRMEQVRNATWQAERPAPTATSPAIDTLGLSASGARAPVDELGAVTFADETPMAAPYADYVRTVRVTSCDAAPGCGGVIDAALRRVTVTVSYRPTSGVGATPAGAGKAAVLTVYVARR
jgi:prepilin-type N-terminal cleavage/methylation domain-containing protein